MKIDLTLFIQIVENKVTYCQAHSQGVDYYPLDHSVANGIHRLTFQIEGEQDKTPALAAAVEDGIGTGEALGD